LRFLQFGGKGTKKFAYMQENTQKMFSPLYFYIIFLHVQLQCVTAGYFDDLSG